MPSKVRSWFGGANGIRSERCDTYLVDGRPDVGMKRRFGEKLELKVRSSQDEDARLTEGLAGSLEDWRRWSPADGLVVSDCTGPWIDVCKSIVKRRFTIDGTEIAFSSEFTGAGCDVEVVDVAVGADRWWSFAFAAFGPKRTRRDALLASWRALAPQAPVRELFTPAPDRSMDYPEWLALRV
jgi:hypothetical protein